MSEAPTQHKSERALTWGFGVLPVVLMLLLGGGVLDLPMNDEFSYARLAESFGKTGRIQLNGWGTPLMLPQMVIGAAIIKVFGFKYGILHWVGILSTAVASGFLFRFLRSAGASVFTAVTLWAAIVGTPMVLAAGPSFLTDIPTMALSLVSWTLFAEALRSGESPEKLRTKVIIATIFALLAALNRQNVILPFGVAIAVISGFRPAWRSILLPGAVVIVGAGLLAVSLIGKLPYAVPVHPIAGLLAFIGWPDVTIKFMIKFGITTGLLVLPAVLIGMQQRKPSWPVAALVFVWLLIFIVLPMGARYIDMFGPIYRLTVYGQYWTTMGVVVGGVHGFGDRTSVPNLGYLWSAVGVLGTVGSFALLANQFRGLPGWIKSRDSIDPSTILSLSLVLFVFVQCVSLVPWLSINNMFDRYLLLIIPFVMAVHIAPTEGSLRLPWLRWGAVAVALCNVVWGLISTHDYFAYSRARMELYNEALALGIAPENLDAGVEYNADYQIRVEGKINNRQMEPASAFDETRIAINVDYEPEKFPAVLAAYRISSSTFTTWMDGMLTDKAGNPVEREYVTIIDGKRKMVVGHVAPSETP